MPKNKELGKVGQYKISGTFFEEFLPELRGIKGVEVYKEMSNNDEMVYAILFAVEMLIRNCKFTVEGASEKEIDKKAAEFIEECMHDMQYTWQETLSEILSFITYGWSYHELVYKRRVGKTKNPRTSSKYDDGLIGWCKIPIRSQDTLYAWKYDEMTDDFLGMIQSAPPTYEQILIPIEKSLHFTTKSNKANPEGRSILRGAYRSWAFKKRLQEIEGIGIERGLAGFPVLTGPEGVNLWDTKDDPEMQTTLSRLEAIVSGIRMDERAGLVLPEGYKLEFLGPTTKSNFDINETIERYDKRIATTVMADFILLGQQSVGSFALSSNKTKLFSCAIGAYLDTICEVFNNQAIPRLIDLNEAHFKGIADYPKMVHSDIEEPDLEKLGNFIKDMVGCGALFPDEGIDDYIRQVAKLPERQDDYDYGLPQEGDDPKGSGKPSVSSSRKKPKTKDDPDDEDIEEDEPEPDDDEVK